MVVYPTAQVVLGFVMGTILVLVPQLIVIAILYLFPSTKKQKPWPIKKPMPLKKDPWAKYQDELSLEGKPAETCHWLNALLANLYCDLHQDVIMTKFAAIINEEIDDLKMEPEGVLLGGTKLVNHTVGSVSPVFDNFIVHQVGEAGKPLMFSVDLQVDGEQTLNIETELLAIGLPIKVFARFSKIKATLLFEFNTHPEKVFAFSFYPGLQIDLKIQVQVGNGSIPMLDKVVSMIATKVATGKLRTKFSLPQQKTKYLLYETNPLRSGYLWLQHRPDDFSAKSWFSRPKRYPWKFVWVQLKNEAVSWFVDHSRPKALLTISASSIVSVTRESSPSGYELCIKVVVSDSHHAEVNGSYYFALESEEDYEEWWRLFDIMFQEAKMRKETMGVDPSLTAGMDVGQKSAYNHVRALLESHEVQEALDRVPGHRAQGFLENVKRLRKTLADMERRANGAESDMLLLLEIQSMQSYVETLSLIQAQIKEPGLATTRSSLGTNNTLSVANSEKVLAPGQIPTFHSLDVAETPGGGVQNMGVSSVSAPNLPPGNLAVPSSVSKNGRSF
eukprot:comp22520_c0_seq1/m.34133 comp22520_c0_seq1/g.34133  ORF comp22520_c0_seq1/g.34133 comp22520_c0_seq1/m.34133 type:complete len:559 (-) comp22520_c0_seq1:934-2610(-)